jgi:hypothetical protein
MKTLQPKTEPVMIVLTINFSLFSALAICQVLLESIYHPWLFLLCILGGLVNLVFLYFLVSKKNPDKITEEKAVSEFEKNKLMDDLEEEAVRRKRHDQIEQN